jgi:hypothetical protein
VAAAIVAAAAVAAGVAAIGGAFGGSAQSTGAAQAARGLPPCFTNLVAHAVELPTGIDVPLGSLREATGRAFTFLLESGKPIGAVEASVHGGRAPFFRIENMRDTRCGAVRGTAVDAPGGYPNLKNYDAARANFAGTTYDFELSDNSGQLSARLSVPKRPAMTVAARRTGGRLSVQGTLPSGAYGGVTLTYRATQPGGTTFQRSVTVTVSNGAFGGSWPLGAAGRQLRRGTITAAFAGDSSYLSARAQTTVR